MPSIFQLGSLAAAWADPWLWRVREEAQAQIRGERRGCFLCVSDEEGWAGPEHWMWHSLGAEQFLKCCVLPQTLGLGLEKNQFKIKFCPFQLGKVPALD